MTSRHLVSSSAFGARIALLIAVTSAYLILLHSALECLTMDTRTADSFDLFQACANVPHSESFHRERYGLNTSAMPYSSASKYVLSHNGNGQFCGETSVGLLELFDGDMFFEVIYRFRTTEAPPFASTLKVQAIIEDFVAFERAFVECNDWQVIRGLAAAANNDVRIRLLAEIVNDDELLIETIRIGNVGSVAKECQLRPASGVDPAMNSKADPRITATDEIDPLILAEEATMAMTTTTTDAATDVEAETTDGVVVTAPTTTTTMMRPARNADEQLIWMGIAIAFVCLFVLAAGFATYFYCKPSLKAATQTMESSGVGACKSTPLDSVLWKGPQLPRLYVRLCDEGPIITGMQ